MSQGMIGANPDELRALAAAFDAKAELCDGAGRTVRAEVEGVQWFGADADRFRAEVAEVLAAAIAMLAEELSFRAEGLDAQAAEQDAASAARGGSGGAPAAPLAPAPAPFAGGLAMDISSIFHDVFFPDPVEQRPRAEPLPLDQRPDLADIQERYQVKEDVMVTVTVDDREQQLPLSEAIDLAKQKALGNEGRIREIKALADEIGRGEGETDGHGDALRHTYLNALLASELGQQTAYDMGTSHEQKTDNEARAEAMDLYNNEVGRAIAAAHPNASREELRGLVEQAARNGELIVVGPDGNLAWSDQVAPGQTGSTYDQPQDDPAGTNPGTVGEGRPGPNPYAL